MAIKRLVKTNELKFNSIRNMVEEHRRSLYLRYDKQIDTLFILWVSPGTGTIVHFIDNHVALLYKPNNKEVVGVQIEDFEYSFIKEYVEVQKAWRLSDACKEVDDLGDLSIVFEKQKTQAAEEVGTIADHLLNRRDREAALV